MISLCYGIIWCYLRTNEAANRDPHKEGGWVKAISRIIRSGGLTDRSFGLHIFDRLLLVVALGIPVMPTVNRDYLKLVFLYVYVNSTYSSVLWRF